MNTFLVVIGIPTFKRTRSLLRLLRSIDQIELPENIQLEIGVADNEGWGSETEKNLEARSAAGRFDIHFIGVSERGISYTRNALLSLSFDKLNADILVMVDDDEIVSTHWLLEFLKTQEATKADLIGGRKLPVFQAPPEEWMLKNSVFYYEPAEDDGICKRLVSTDNLLITKHFYLKSNNAKFDHEFALTGGGDTEYLHRMSEIGATLAYSRNAVSYEVIPIERMSYDWARKRAFRIGIGLARINMMHKVRAIEKIKQYSRLGLILIISLLLSISYFRNKPQRFQYLIYAYQQFGKLSGYRGHLVYPYK